MEWKSHLSNIWKHPLMSKKVLLKLSITKIESEESSKRSSQRECVKL